MAITLGGTELNGSLQWEERYTPAVVAQTAKRTLGGNVVVFHQTLRKGEPITLVATEDTGWFTLSMVDAIIAMAKEAGSTYTLDYHGEVHTVMLRHNEHPAVSFSPLTPRDNAQAGDYFTGTVKLFTI